MANSTTYLLNAPIIGVIDTSLSKQDVTPLIVQMPASWNKPKTRWRIRAIGTFQLPNGGDLFYRKIWMGKTQITFCATQAIRPNEARVFRDDVDILWYGDNLHAIQGTFHTALVSTGAFTPGQGNTGDSSQFRDAVPSTTEISMSDSPIIVDGNLNNVSLSLFTSTQSKVGFSVREFAIEKLEV